MVGLKNFKHAHTHTLTHARMRARARTYAHTETDSGKVEMRQIKARIFSVDLSIGNH